MQKKIIYIIVAVIAILVLAAAIFYFYQKPAKTPSQAQQEAIDKALLLPVPEINGDLIGNPLKGAPSVNPVDKIANPYEDGYKNPFATNE